MVSSQVALVASAITAVRAFSIPTIHLVWILVLVRQTNYWLVSTLEV